MRLSLVIAAVGLAVCSGQNLRRGTETGLLENNEDRELTLGELIESQALQKQKRKPKSKRSKEGNDERMGSNESDNKKKERKGETEVTSSEKKREGVKDKPEKREKDLEKERGKHDKEEKKKEGKDRGEANNEKKQKKDADEKKKPDDNGDQNQDPGQGDQDAGVTSDSGVTSGTDDGILSRGRLGFLGLLRPCNFFAQQFDVPIKCEIDLLRSLLRDRQIKFKVSLEKALCADNRLTSICVTPSFKGALDFDDRLLSTEVEFGDMRIGDSQLGDLSLSLGTCFSRNSRALSSQSMLAIPNKEFVRSPDNVASIQGEQPSGSALNTEEALLSPSSTSDLVDTENTTDTPSPDGVPSPNSTKDELSDGNTAVDPSVSVMSNDTDVDVPSTLDDEPPVDDTSDGGDGNGGGDVDDDSGSNGGGLCTCNAAYKGRSCQLCEFCRGGGVRFDCSNIVPMISSGGQCQSIDAITSLLGNGQRILPTIPDFLFNLISN